MVNVQLIKCCQAGDPGSMNELYKAYHKNALGTAYLISGHKGIAEDIVHEAYFKCSLNFTSLDAIYKREL